MADYAGTDAALAAGFRAIAIGLGVYSGAVKDRAGLMLFDQVSQTQMQAAQLLTGATMAGFVVAHFFGGRARTVRLLIAGVYFAGVSGLIVYSLL